MQSICTLIVFLFLAHAPALFGKDDLIPAYTYQRSELTLNGTWLFVPEIFLSPENMPDLASRPHQLVLIPNDLPAREHPAWGTLVIRVKDLDKAHEDMGLWIRANSAYRVFLYNPAAGPGFQSVLTVGTPAATDADSIPENVDRLGVLRKTETGPDVLLVVHISGWHSHSACIWGIPKILPLNQASRHEDWARFIEALALGTLLTMALYFLLFAMRQKEDSSAFWLALLAVFAAIRLSVTSGTLLNLAMFQPSIATHAILRKLEYGAIPALGFTGLAFVVQCFGATQLRRFIQYDGLVTLALFLICLLTPSTHLHYFLHLLNAHVFFHFLVGLYICSKSIRTHTSGTIALFIGITINMLTALHDIAVGSGASWTTGHFLSPFGVAALIFSQGQILSINFDRAYRLAARLSKDLSREVERQTAEVKTIMNTIPQGVMIINGSGHVETGVSPQVRHILAKNTIEGEFWASVLLDQAQLSADQKQVVRETVKIALNEHVMNFDVNRGNLPDELKILRPSGLDTYLELTWSPLLNRNNIVESILVTLFDATQKKIDEMEAQKNEYEMQLVREIVTIPLERYQAFRDSSQTMLDEMEFTVMGAESPDPTVIRKIYLNAHTLKGISRTLGLQYLANALHEMEASLDIFRRESSHEHHMVLKENFQKVKVVFGDYQKVNDHTLGRARQDNTSLTIPADTVEHCSSVLTYLEEQITDEAVKGELKKLTEKLIKLTHIPLQIILGEAVTDLDKMARDLNKPCPTTRIMGVTPYLNKKAASALRNALVHLLRNSMDHGLESASERVAQGKKPEGLVKFDCSMDDKGLTIIVADDGRGLAIEDIRRKGLSRGLLSQEESQDPDQVAQLIFHPNFSTASNVTQYSGRGVGMNAVRSSIEEIGGSVVIQFIDLDQQRTHRSFQLNICIPIEYCSRL